MSGGESITVLRCAPGLRMAKLIRPGDIATYDSARTYDAWSVPVADLAELHALLLRIIPLPRLCVVRGELVAGKKAFGIRRLLWTDPKTGDEPTLRDVPRRWVALDMDGVERPEHVPAADLQACAALAITRLPSGFREAACIVQATAGHGIKPGCRLRLWYWLDRQTSGDELKRWLRGTPVDPSTLRPAQVTYTAAPVFNGVDDPLADRLVMLPGVSAVRVPSAAALAPPPRPAPAPLPKSSDPGASRYAWAALRNAITRIGNAPVDSRHPACLREARYLARFVPAGLLTVAEVERAVMDGLEQAGKSREEGAALAAWALAHPSTAPLPEGIR